MFSLHLRQLAAQQVICHDSSRILSEFHQLDANFLIFPSENALYIPSGHLCELRDLVKEVVKAHLSPRLANLL